MAKYEEDAQELVQAVLRCEPTAQVEIKKRFLRQSWFVRVTRDGVVADYEDINHYWLAECIIATFGRGRQ